jgi:hypothetical protein
MTQEMNGVHFDFESLQALARKEGKDIKQFIVMGVGNDPFAVESESRERDAQWFAEFWQAHTLGYNVHLRRIHYVLVSKEGIVLPNGKPYENTDGCWGKLLQAGRDARYLGLLPAGVRINDQRNPEAECHLVKAEASDVGVDDGARFHKNKAGKLPKRPELFVNEPTIPQRYHVEIWAEKSTQNDILKPLASHYGLNLFAGAGEVSLTRCDELIERAEASQRPVRVLYISDFDPACQSAFKFDPRSASNFDPLWRRVLAVALAPSELVGVAETARARVGG